MPAESGTGRVKGCPSLNPMAKSPCPDPKRARAPSAWTEDKSYRYGRRGVNRDADAAEAALARSTEEQAKHNRQQEREAAKGARCL